MVFLSLGKIIGTHNLDGEFKVLSTSYYEEERYKENATLYITSEDEKIIKKVTVKNFSKSGKIVYVLFNEINSVEEAEKYKSFYIKIDKNDAKIKENEYLFIDLINCKIINNETKKEIGVVKKIEEFPAQITLRVKGQNNKDFFVPFIKQFIIKVDITNKQIFVKVIKGML